MRQGHWLITQAIFMLIVQAISSLIIGQSILAQRIPLINLGVAIQCRWDLLPHQLLATPTMTIHQLFLASPLLQSHLIQHLKSHFLMHLSLLAKHSEVFPIRQPRFVRYSTLIKGLIQLFPQSLAPLTHFLFIISFSQLLGPPPALRNHLNQECLLRLASLTRLFAMLVFPLQILKALRFSHSQLVHFEHQLFAIQQLALKCQLFRHYSMKFEDLISRGSLNTIFFIFQFTSAISFLLPLIQPQSCRLASSSHSQQIASLYPIQQQPFIIIFQSTLVWLAFFIWWKYFLYFQTYQSSISFACSKFKMMSPLHSSQQGFKAFSVMASTITAFQFSWLKRP